MKETTGTDLQETGIAAECRKIFDGAQRHKRNGQRIYAYYRQDDHGCRQKT
jgi:hypothetical protein